MPGNSYPLPYIPVINPLEIQQAFCIAGILFWLTRNRSANIHWKKIVFIIGDSAAFLWITAVIARSVHFYAQIPMSSLPESSLFHLGIFIFWALYGIAHIIAGNKTGHRAIWITGAIITIVDIVKLILLDLAGTGTVIRIISFFIAGLILLFIGWVAPLPPERIPEESNER